MTDCERAALLCDLIRSDQPYVESILSQHGFSSCRFFSNGIQAFIADQDRDPPHTRWLVFRGTDADDPRDWLANLDLSRVETERIGSVHHGFLTALIEQCWAGISSAVLDGFDTRPRRFATAGHSQGGALANIAAAMFGQSLKVDSLITFGCPRVGDKRFAAAVDVNVDRHLRCVNNNDVVARIPIPISAWTAMFWSWLTRSPLPLAPGYRHAPGDVIYFTADGGLRINPPKWFLVRDRLRGRWLDLLEWGTDGIKDHAMDRYLSLVQRHAKQIG